MLIQEIKADRLSALKSNNVGTYTTLTTLLSEIGRLEKIDQKEDDKVQAVITKYIKGLDEMIKIVETCESMKKEKEILSGYLPTQLTEEELREHIQLAIVEVNAETPRDMGKVMKLLKERKGGLYDGKVASTIVKQQLG